MITRSLLPEVRNPLLRLESARRLADWLRGTELAPQLAVLLEDLARDARLQAQASWRSHKAPMALYWKIVAVYTRHLARICRSLGRAAA